MADAALTHAAPNGAVRLPPRRAGRRLDRLARTRLTVGSRSWSTYEASGYVGIVAGGVLAVVLAAGRGLPVLVMVGAVATGVATFLLVVRLTVQVVGWPYLNCYYHSGAVVLSISAMLWATGQPVLPYVEIVVVGLCAFLVAGRIGCLMVGCCHGRPHPAGIAYGSDHVIEGFPPRYEGVRLFPIQLVECALVLVLAVAGSWLIVVGTRTGTALVTCLVGYALGRSFVELGRGDAERPYWRGLSAAQWVSGGVAAGVALAALTGALPASPLPIAAAAVLLALLSSLVVWTRTNPLSRPVILGARHLREVTEAVRAASAEPPGRPAAAREPVDVRHTSLGIRVSVGSFHDGEARVVHCTLSSARRPMTERAARHLGRTIAALQDPDATMALLPGPHSVFHVIVARR